MAIKTIVLSYFTASDYNSRRCILLWRDYNPNSFFFFYNKNFTYHPHSTYVTNTYTQGQAPSEICKIHSPN